MDVFGLRQQVIGDYASYIRSFFTIRDERIRTKVDAALAEGHLWPDPLLQLSPAFETRKIFAIKRDDGTVRASLRLHRHQVEGIRAARTGDSYVLTTGTGSGKSLSYIAPIVDHALRNPKRGSVKAIVVYPMNALANSQVGELTKYLSLGYPKDRPPVSFHRYTGQENDAQRREIIADPPDILLTNYVMLEIVYHFDHRFATYEGQTKAQPKQGKCPELSDARPRNSGEACIALLLVIREGSQHAPRRLGSAVVVRLAPDLPNFRYKDAYLFSAAGGSVWRLAILDAPIA